MTETNDSEQKNTKASTYIVFIVSWCHVFPRSVMHSQPLNRSRETLSDEIIFFVWINVDLMFLSQLYIRGGSSVAGWDNVLAFPEHQALLRSNV